MHIDSISRSPPCNDINYSIIMFTARFVNVITLYDYIMEV